MISPAAWQLERHVVMAYSVRHAMRDPLAVIQAHVTEFTALGARRIGVFGSFVRGETRGDSDVDVYVEFDDQRRTYDNFFALHELLERLMGRRVDCRRPCPATIAEAVLDRCFPAGENDGRQRRCSRLR